MKYKTVNWNTGPNRKSEPPADKKLIKRLHKKWCKANGYKPQASSRKLQAASA
jgi:hypothetical protein|tara:strand:+ start:303 stop:461 length:159 start_codon:yes stop_codon:yes gene_type:complete